MPSRKSEMTKLSAKDTVFAIADFETHTHFPHFTLDQEVFKALLQTEKIKMCNNRGVARSNEWLPSLSRQTLQASN